MANSLQGAPRNVHVCLSATRPQLVKAAKLLALAIVTLLHAFALALTGITPSSPHWHSPGCADAFLVYLSAFLRADANLALACPTTASLLFHETARIFIPLFQATGKRVRLDVIKVVAFFGSATSIPTAPLPIGKVSVTLHRRLLPRRGAKPRSAALFRLIWLPCTALIVITLATPAEASLDGAQCFGNNCFQLTGDKLCFYPDPTFNGSNTPNQCSKPQIRLILNQHLSTETNSSILYYNSRSGNIIGNVSVSIGSPGTNDSDIIACATGAFSPMRGAQLFFQTHCWITHGDNHLGIVNGDEICMVVHEHARAIEPECNVGSGSGLGSLSFSALVRAALNFTGALGSLFRF